LVPPDSKEYYILNIESPDSQTDTMIMIMIMIMIQCETEKWSIVDNGSTKNYISIAPLRLA
jgi:hypothetical protein